MKCFIVAWGMIKVYKRTYGRHQRVFFSFVIVILDVECPLRCFDKFCRKWRMASTLPGVVYDPGIEQSSWESR